MKIIIKNKICNKHGETIFVLRKDGRFRCRKCNNDGVKKKIRNRKIELVKKFGGKCVRCGYDKYVGALHFHHINPKDKSFGIASKYQSYSINRLIIEAQKCILVCANCHSEIENEMSL